MSMHVRRTCAMKRLHYRACTPYMHVVFNMFETSHMYAVHVRCLFTLSYMYGVHARRTGERRTCLIV